MTTIHANSTTGAIEQMVLLVGQAGTQLSRQDIREYVKSTIGVFVQLERAGGTRRVAAMMVG